MAKTVSFGTKPTQKTTSVDQDEWVRNALTSNDSTVISPTSEETPSGPKRMKRLTIDISEELHRQIKIVCAKEGLSIADEVRTLLQTRFGEATN